MTVQVPIPAPVQPQPKSPPPAAAAAQPALGQPPPSQSRDPFSLRPFVEPHSLVFPYQQARRKKYRPAGPLPFARRPVRYSHEAFRRRMIENPDDRVAPLVYADWLDEQGLPHHAEVIRRAAAENHPEGLFTHGATSWADFDGLSITHVTTTGNGLGRDYKPIPVGDAVIGLFLRPPRDRRQHDSRILFQPTMPIADAARLARGLKAEGSHIPGGWPPALAEAGHPEVGPERLARRPVRYAAEYSTEFHRAIHAEPSNPLHTLAYADHLEESGKPAVARFLRWAAGQGPPEVSSASSPNIALHFGSNPEWELYSAPDLSSHRGFLLSEPSQAEPGQEIQWYAAIPNDWVGDLVRGLRADGVRPIHEDSRALFRDTPERLARRPVSDAAALAAAVRARPYDPVARGVLADYLEERDLAGSPDVPQILRTHPGSVWAVPDEDGRVLAGPTKSLDDIRREMVAGGSHFWDADTMRYFGTRVGDKVFSGPGGHWFVTSEYSGFDRRGREYNLRHYDPSPAEGMGEIHTVRGYGNRPTAERHAARLALSPSKTHAWIAMHDLDPGQSRIGLGYHLVGSGLASWGDVQQPIMNPERSADGRIMHAAVGYRGGQLTINGRPVGPRRMARPRLSSQEVSIAYRDYRHRSGLGHAGRHLWWLARGRHDLGDTARTLAAAALKGDHAALGALHDHLDEVGHYLGTNLNYRGLMQALADHKAVWPSLILPHYFDTSRALFHDYYSMTRFRNSGTLGPFYDRIRQVAEQADRGEQSQWGEAWQRGDQAQRIVAEGRPWLRGPERLGRGDRRRRWVGRKIKELIASGKHPDRKTAVLAAFALAKQYQENDLDRFSRRRYAAQPGPDMRSFHTAMEQSRASGVQDATAALVYADWLEERGMPGVARVIRQHAVQFPPTAGGYHAAHMIVPASVRVPPGLFRLGVYQPSDDDRLIVSVEHGSLVAPRQIRWSAWMPRAEAADLANQIRSEGVAETPATARHLDPGGQS